MITFETKVWEKDWEYILKGDYLEKIITANDYNFTKRHIIINNVKNRHLVEKYCEQKVKEGIIDRYFAVEEYEIEVLKYFDIAKESFAGGYHYSIAELVGIYKCETEYLLHYSGDSFLNKSNKNWIKDALEIMNSDNKIFVANPVWNGKWEEVINGAIDEVGDFFVGRGFSDQCYLIRQKDFMGQIYNEKNPLSDQYPLYGGELFEKRVDAFMRNNGKLRINHKYASYVSANFPRSWVARKILKKKINQQRINQIENNIILNR